MSEYPEHDKLRAIADESQAIGEFLEWMGTDRTAEHGQYGRRLFLAHMWNDRLTPASYTIEDLLAQFFGIDQNKIEAEKRQMLAELRAVNR